MIDGSASVTGEFNVYSQGVYGGGGDVPEVDDAIEDFLENGGTFEFNYKGHDYTIVEENGNFVAYDSDGNIVDADVQVNSRNTVNGFLEVRGLYETQGNAVYIGNDPASEDGEVLFIEGDHDLNRLDTDSNPHLSTLLGYAHEALTGGNSFDFEILKANLNFEDAQQYQLDDDSSISIDELDRYLQSEFGIELSDDQIEELFSMIDRNGSGNIREREWDSFVGSSSSEGGVENVDSREEVEETAEVESQQQVEEEEEADPTPTYTGPDQTQTFSNQPVHLSRVRDNDGNRVDTTLNGPFVLAMNQSGNTSMDSPEVVDARDNWRSFTTHDGFEVETKYQKLLKDGPTVTDPDGANYAVIKFSSGGNDSTNTPNLERLGLDPADEGVTYRIVGRDPDASRGEDGYDGVYGSFDSSQLVIEILDPDAPFTFHETSYSEGSVTFIKTDAEIEVLGGNYVDSETRSDERYVTYNPEASLTIYHEDQGTQTRRLDNIVAAEPYGAYIGDDGSNNWVDNVTVFLNPEGLEDLSGGRGLHGNGSYLDIRFY